MPFSPLAVEALGWYVYLLVDSLNGEVFYVGKGRGNRAFAHQEGAIDSADHPELQGAKYRRILQIMDAGGTVEIRVLRHAIDTEKQAYVIESAAIDLLESLQSGQLLNVVMGHYHAQHGLMTADEIETLYAAPEAPEPEQTIMLVSLNTEWNPLITDERLKYFTTHWWKAGGVRWRKPQYIAGVHNGVVRSIYRPIEWMQAPDDPSRWGCEVEDAPEMAHWLKTSVKRFLTAKQWAIRYIGPSPTS